MTKDKLQQLLDKFEKGTCTLEERQMLELWFDQQSIQDKQELNEDAKIRMWQQIELNTGRASTIVPLKRSYKRWVAAAAILICCSLGYYMFSQRPSETNQIVEVPSNEILPGENKAVLTLSDGRQIALSDKASNRTEDQGVSITKTADGLLRYQIDPDQAAGNGFNSISTPRGGQYEVILPDGSQVTLNAASSLKFAVNMHHQDQRVVELTGEGYFKVAKNPKRPFIVKSQHQEIKVLGTVFNVNSYQPTQSQTTLLEGSVLINQKQKLRPGQQAQVGNHLLLVKEVDVEDYIDWINNKFIFRNESLESIMERVSRWYNIDYTFANTEAKGILFNGEISRYSKVDDVLNLLKLTSKVKFDVTGRQINIR